MVGLPTCGDGPTEDLEEVDRALAVQVLAFAATESLAYSGNRQPRASYRKLADAALRDLQTGAVFLTGAPAWGSGGRAVSYSALLTSATFEAGIIAYDADNALIYWVEEED